MSGPAFDRYGGHTTCYEIVLADGHRLIVDGGSGLSSLQASLASASEAPPFEATVLLTHFHWDHIQGLPYFEPMYAPTSRIRFVAAPPAGYTLESALDNAMRPPWFPVRLLDTEAAVSFEPLSTGRAFAGDVQVTSIMLRHPGGATGYRIVVDGRSLVIATDVQAGDPAGDAALRTLAEGASVLLHDAQYTPSEWATTRHDWGRHSTWEHATAVAAEARVERLLLTSHDPGRTDEAIDAIVRSARERFAATDAAFQGQVIDV